MFITCLANIADPLIGKWHCVSSTLFHGYCEMTLILTLALTVILNCQMLRADLEAILRPEGGAKMHLKLSDPIPYKVLQPNPNLVKVTTLYHD